MVPILEYHDVLPKERNMVRSIDHFKHDLERLYTEGYRPVLLRDYLDNKIDLPIGMAPVVFTFDDARASQFRYLPSGEIDPTCAVGIWQDFAKTHPISRSKRRSTFCRTALRSCGGGGERRSRHCSRWAARSEITPSPIRR